MAKSRSIDSQNEALIWPVDPILSIRLFFRPIPLRVSEVKRAGLAGEAWNS